MSIYLVHFLLCLPSKGDFSKHDFLLIYSLALESDPLDGVVCWLVSKLNRIKFSEKLFLTSCNWNPCQPWRTDTKELFTTSIAANLGRSTSSNNSSSNSNCSCSIA